MIYDSESDLYARLLFSRGRGHPLWIPEPPDDLCEDYRRGGVRIGDVGVVTADGNFDFIFNICVPANDPLNVLGVPSGFKQLELAPGDVRHIDQRYSPGSDVSSTSIKKLSLDVSLTTENLAVIPSGASAGVQISTSSKEGAVLILPEGASSHDLRRRRAFQNYTLEHGLAWYRFVNETLEREVENGSLYLVTGCDKTSSWGVAAFSNSSGEGEISLKFSAAPISSGRVSLSWQWDTNSPAAVRSGPIRGEGEDGWGENQCVFLRGFKVAVRERLAVLRGPINISLIEKSGPTTKGGFIPFSGDNSPKPSLFRRWDSCHDRSNDPRDDSPRPLDLSSDLPMESCNETMLEHVPSMSATCHPSAIINKYILDSMPDVDIVVSHDDDWCSLLNPDDDIIPDEHELLLRFKDKYCIEVNPLGGASLTPKSGFQSVLIADQPMLQADVSPLDLNDSEDPPGQCFNEWQEDQADRPRHYMIPISPEEAYIQRERSEGLRRRAEVEANLGIYARHTLCRLLDTSADLSLVISNDDNLVPLTRDVAEDLTPSSTAPNRVLPQIPSSLRPSGSLHDSRPPRMIVPQTTHLIHTRASLERHQSPSHPMHITAASESHQSDWEMAHGRGALEQRQNLWHALPSALTISDPIVLDRDKPLESGSHTEDHDH